MRTKSGSVVHQNEQAGQSIEITGNSQDDDASESRVAKRKRRLSKPSDKKYSCPHQGCGKTYSRAEHLYRHQLNHAPKQIYHCDFEGCDRHFVRHDLCARHRERHTKENSHLSRRSISKHNRNDVQSPASSSSRSDTRNLPTSGQLLQPMSETDGPDGRSSVHMNINKPPPSQSGFSSMAVDSQLGSTNPTFESDPRINMFPSPNLDSGYINEEIIPHSNREPISAQSGFAFGYASGPQQDSLNTERPPSLQDTTKSMNNDASGNTFAHPRTNLEIYQLNSTQNLFNSPQVGPLPPLAQTYMSTPSTSSFKHPPSSTSIGMSSNGFPFTAQMPTLPSLRSDSVTSYVANHYTANCPPHASLPGTTISSDAIAGMMVPVFNSESYGLSYDLPGTEFFPWLFESEHNAMYPPTTQSSNNTVNGALHNFYGDMGFSSNAALPQLPLHTVKTPEIPRAAVLSEGVLSEARRQGLLDMILRNFRDERHAQITKQRETALQGNHDQDSHVLSLRMMRAYISSYWVHVHPQLPILHKPTFSADTCPDLLLVSVMILGASCLEASYGFELTQSCTEFSFFLAWHARHMIFEEPDFLPPAKLWVFQALLLLEVFEKMYSTTILHQRAHVHHSTTLTLMRRGSSLNGRAAYDFLPHEKDPTRTPPGPNGSINTAGRNTSDEWWNAWISNEATRRTAFAAFILDSLHATMFGHSAVMVAQELRIPLPCDEALWSTPNGSDVKMLEQNLAMNGYKPQGFLEALKKTLNTQSVPTNTFGRVIIMTGLLNVSWYMKMQDVRAKSIGVGRQDGWREQLERAFDFWKRDFDDTLAKNHDMFLHDRHFANVADKDKDFESRTVLHHLAHLAINVDMVDCQILAGAKRSLGRVITIHDEAAVRKRMKETWAPSRHAREATFYALKFLSAVLLPEDDGTGLTDTHQNRPLKLVYSARDDNLINRPWVLYFATLVVWSYGYCMDGPIVPPGPTYTLPTHELQFRDMQIFLLGVGGIKSPDDLQHVKPRNGCLGMLMLLKDLFGKTRWELLHEASDLLGSCIELLMPGISST